jgi:hypothetical protein
MNARTPVPATAGATSGERRSTRRLEIRINLAGNVSSSRVRLANISEGGCLVYASSLLNAGDTHVLRFNPDGEELQVAVRVVHAVRASGIPDAACVAGLEFSAGSDVEQRAAIERLVTVVERLNVAGESPVVQSALRSPEH